MKKDIKVKVCGMRDAGNIKELIQLSPDYIGFIFYPHSKRYVGDDFPASVMESIPSSIKKVGVFVDELLEHVVRKCNKYQLDYVQLHGKEQVAYCQELMTVKTGVIKSFGVDERFDFSLLEKYAGSCDYFLFDTKSPQHGGTGQKFDWNNLKKMLAGEPFFLSGGIGREDAESIKNLDIPGLMAVDINSKFELSPGMKDINMIENFIYDVRKA